MPHVQDVLIAIGFFTAAFGIVYVLVTARNRERLAMIDKGINPLEHKKESSNLPGLLRWALFLIGIGSGVFIGSVLEATTSIQEEAAYFGSIIFFGGSGLLLAFLIIRNKSIE